MQTFDVLIAPGPSSNSVSCLSPPPPPFPPLPPFSSLPLWGGITQENRKGGSGSLPSPSLPRQPTETGRVVGVGPPPSWLFVGSKWRGQGCQLGAGLPAKLPGNTAAGGWGPGLVWPRLWTGARVLPEDSIVSRASQGPEAGTRPNFWSGCPTNLLCGLKQVIVSGSQSLHLYRWKRYPCPAYLTGLL